MLSASSIVHSHIVRFRDGMDFAWGAMAHTLFIAERYPCTIAQMPAL